MNPTEIFDSTLRDGAQARGISFTVEDKENIIRALDRLGVRYVEAGNPYSNPKDMAFFERIRQFHLRSSEIVAFGSTRRKDSTAEQDEGCASLLRAGTRAVAIFGKSSRTHATQVLNVSLEENLRMIHETVAYFTGQGRTVFYDAEHFFDGYREDPLYAFETLRAAFTAGARRLILCDTNGGTFPDDIGEITRKAAGEFPDIVGIHCHDDMGCAVAGSIAAVKNGAVQVQGTLLGFGERCGNANLSAIIPSLQLKMGSVCVPPSSLPLLTRTVRYVAEIANVIPAAGMPYVGVSAFAHKGGMHVAAVEKYSASFEHLDPAAVGNEREILLSEVSGRASLLAKLRGVAPDLQKDSPETAELMELLKQKEYDGFQYESASASFELMVLKKLGRFSPPYQVELFRILGEQSGQTLIKLSSALVKVRVGEKVEITADEGEGPVNALDKALRKALEVFYPVIRNMSLIDYKVRVIEPGDATAAKVRVFIETTDGASAWTTVGVSQDIINASFMALTDSVDYKLMLETTGKHRRLEMEA